MTRLRYYAGRETPLGAQVQLGGMVMKVSALTAIAAAFFLAALPFGASAQTHVAELRLQRAKARLDVAETFAAGQLRERHAEEQLSWSPTRSIHKVFTTPRSAPRSGTEEAQSTRRQRVTDHSCDAEVEHTVESRPNANAKNHYERRSPCPRWLRGELSGLIGWD